MPRPRTRWVVTVEDETGGRSVYGPWYAYDIAKKHHDELANISRRYGGDGPEWEVDVDALEPWPGIRAITEPGS